MAKKRVFRRKKLPQFNMYAWSATIPFSEDLWLGMQARNLALVDMGWLRGMESESLSLYFQMMRTPAMELTFQSAVSQMWIFAVYEFLRTWRERAKHLIKLADEYKTVQVRKRAKFVADAIEVARGKEKHVRVAMTFGSHNVGKIADEKFMDLVRAYFSKTDALFSEIEALRVTLAKHQVPQTRGFAAEAPGYARMNYENGALYWQITDKDGASGKVDRREISDALFGIGTEFAPPPLSSDEG
jgi:hypothetical protein